MRLATFAIYQRRNSGTLFDNITVRPYCMLDTNFYLNHTESGNAIYDEKSLLRINIYNLEDNKFRPNPTELQFYTINRGRYIAFETVDIKAYLRPLVANALLWYAQYIGQPDLHISTQDPRTSLKAG